MRYLWISLSALFLTLATHTVGFADPNFWRFEWPSTDFSKSSVAFSEILSGGPGKDGIPALTNPAFVSLDQASLPEQEPVISVEVNTEARLYPLRYLTWHEIVNDEIQGVPVAITFCPLCNSALVFDRRVSGQVLDFGVTGKLRNSDMVMYDRQTESWWQQATAEAIVGDLTGVQLTQIPSRMESIKDAKLRLPKARIMAKPTFSRNYGINPYVGYDSSARPFLYSGDPPPHNIPSLARVVRVGTHAWPMTRFQKTPVIHEAGVTLTAYGVQTSALDKQTIAHSKTITSIRVQDAEGRDVAHDVLFAFAFHAFWPNGTWMIGAP